MGKTFKELVQADISTTFMNKEEFADVHNLNFKQMSVIIDDNENIEREKRMKSSMDGIHVKQLLIYVSAAEYGLLPPQSQMITLDGKRYFVVDAVDESGIYSITLEANRS